ncbi:MAG: cobalamin biosynthesis protein CbiD [Candidatus Dadabacteria bacterium]|nr:MAG: cobalamin biosynthesis protein CbiD [Candidatus Dadabacteria bacterium]
MTRKLRSGFTTGACAAAAAKGAALRLFGRAADGVTLDLPWGRPEARPVRFALVNPAGGDGWAACGVVKDAGDDPDVTDGLEIRASVALDPVPPGGRRHDHSDIENSRPSGPAETAIRIEGGEGVGRITKPGLALPVGEPAINPVPRRMIEAAVRDALAEAGVSGPVGLTVVISVPRGAEVARKTLNARLGILGGLSILGTTGIVVPMSHDAWRATIDAGLDVARAAGLGRVVLSHGRSSEAAAQALFPELPEEAFVLMGDHVGYALDAAARRGLSIVLAGQFAKFCKVAAGHFATHVKDSRLDKELVAELLAEAGFPPERVEAARAANTAREVFEGLLTGGDRGVFRALCRRVAARAAERAGGRVPVEAVLFGYDKAVLAREAVP